MRYRTSPAVFFVLFLSSLTFAASGEIDRSFGTGGNGWTYFDTSLTIDALAVQADDKFIGGGRCRPTGAGLHFCMVRFMPNGPIDTTFGVGGSVYTQMAPLGTEWSTIVEIVVQPDGKIIAAGYTEREAVNGVRHNFIAIARYLPDGTLDSSFAQQGRFFDTGTDVSSGMRLFDVALLPSGKLIALTGWPGFTGGGGRVVLLQLNGDGTLDSSFGTGGRAVRDYGSLDDLPGALAVGPDGKIIVGSRGTYDRHFLFERYLPDASYDTTAGNNGRVQFASGGSIPNPFVRKIAVLADGRTIALGNAQDGIWPKISLMLFKPNLALDTTLANTGRLDTNLAPEQYCDPLDFQLREDGRITLGANCSVSSATFAGPSTEIARFRPDGTLDKQFGIGGRYIRRHNRPYTGQSIVQSTGKIIYCGRTTTQSGPAPGVFCERYLDNGSRDSDFDADKKADVSVFRPSSGVWYSNNSQTGFKAVQFGAQGDRIVPADYDADGIVDQAVYRQGIWYQLLSGTNSFRAVSFGLPDDIPMAADYSGDGKADIAVFRGGDWYFLDSTSGQASYVHFGIPSDKPIVGNFDGDLKADPAVYRDGTWFMLNSTGGFSAAGFGLSTDRPVAADYDGDGATDMAVYRDGIWYILGSFTGFKAVSFGLANDRPTPADYDGDGRTDIAVYRDGIWYLLQSTAGFAGIGFGLPEDTPVPSAFVY